MNPDAATRAATDVATGGIDSVEIHLATASTTTNGWTAPKAAPASAPVTVSPTFDVGRVPYLPRTTTRIAAKTLATRAKTNETTSATSPTIGRYATGIRGVCHCQYEAAPNTAPVAVQMTTMPAHSAHVTRARLFVAISL